MIRSVICFLALLVATPCIAGESPERQGLDADQLAAIAAKVAETLGSDGRILTPDEFNEMMVRGAAIYAETGADGVSAASFMLVIYAYSVFVGILLVAWIFSNRRLQNQAYERFEHSEERHDQLLRELQAAHETQEEHDREILRASTEALSELATATTSLASALRDQDSKKDSS